MRFRYKARKPGLLEKARAMDEDVRSLEDYERDAEPEEYPDEDPISCAADIQRIMEHLEMLGDGDELIGAALEILDAAAQAGAVDAESAWDIAYDYDMQARQIRTMMEKYERPHTPCYIGDILICSECGKRVFPNDRYCTHCGYRIRM